MILLLLKKAMARVSILSRRSRFPTSIRPEIDPALIPKSRDAQQDGFTRVPLPGRFVNYSFIFRRFTCLISAMPKAVAASLSAVVQKGLVARVQIVASFFFVIASGSSCTSSTHSPIPIRADGPDERRQNLGQRTGPNRWQSGANIVRDLCR